MKKPACATDPKTVSVVSRANAFKDECMVVSAGKLFCSACREELSTKLSIIKNHVLSMKHSRSKVALAKREVRERDIAQVIQEYDKEVHPIGESLPEAQRVFRVKVVSTFLRAGIHMYLCSSCTTFVKYLSRVPTGWLMSGACMTRFPLFCLVNARN